MWIVEVLDALVTAELEASPDAVLARFQRVAEMIETYGLAGVGAPHLRHLAGSLWEVPLGGRGRAGYTVPIHVVARRRRVVAVRALMKAGRNAQRGEVALALARGKGGDMIRKRARVGELHKKWRKTRFGYAKALAELASEFRLAAQMIEARTRAGLTQDRLAERMKTKRTVIARLEAGRTKPSTRTLEKLAAATGHRLKISFEPDGG